MFKDLDPILHAQVRLSIMSILVNVKSADFSFLLENIQTTKGNLSFQLKKLKEEGYIKIHKSFKGNYPHTSCEVTQKGIDALERYVDSISEYIEEFYKSKHSKS